MSPKQLHRLYAEMAKLVGAGFSAEKAADALLNQHESGPVATFAQGLKNGLNGGMSVADAISNSSLSVSELEKSILKSAEKGGRLEEGFDHLSDYFSLLDSTRKQIIRNALYPIAMIHVAVPLSAFVTSTFTDATFVATLIKWFVIIYGIGAALGFATWFMIKKGKTSIAVDRFLNSIPVVGKARRSLALTRWCKVLHIHLLAGGKTAEGVELAGNASQVAGLQRSAMRMVPEIRSGNPLGPLLLVNSAFPRDFSRAILTAEQAGELDTEMSQWASYMQSSAVASMEGLGEWLPRVFYVIILVFVGYLVVNGYQQYLSKALGILDSIP
ncbi:MAG: type II secretion system F family protein [Verrucomicrobiales bacterium]